MAAQKTALVTGSTSGIGQAIAERFARDGHDVILNGFGDQDEIEANRADLARSADVKVGYSGADLTKPEAIEEMMAYAAADFGGVDILVNNAGVQHVSPIEEFP
ncbi:MAG: SDR family NAD(P)-dependent oxidoreductase, partial [Pseudomonadota bacterium]